MLVTVHTLDGRSRDIPGEAVIRLRPAGGPAEPDHGTMVEFGREHVYAQEPLDVLVTHLAGQVPLARLTTLSGKPIYVDAARVASVEPPEPDDDPMAHAVLVVAGRRQPVRQNVPAVNAILYAARHLS